jgi:hypothetical protein
MSVRALTLVAAGVLALAACGSSAKKATSGTTTPTSSAPPSTTSSAGSSTASPGGAIAAAHHDSVLGDLSTLDACSLVPQSGLTWTGVPSADRVTSYVSQGVSVTTCQVQVAIPSQGLTNVSVDFDNMAKTSALDHPPAGITVSRVGHLRVIHTPQQSAGCAEGVVTPSAVLINIQATPNNNSAKAAPLCRVADAVVADLAAVVANGHVRHLTWPTDSALRVDPCAALPSTAVAQLLPGVTQRSQSPAAHTCGFTSPGNSNVSVEITTSLFNYQQTVQLLQQDASYNGGTFTGNQVTVAGRPTVLGNQPGQTQTNCQALTTARIWPNGFGNDSPVPKGFTTALPAHIYETPTVAITDPGLPQSKLCQMAQTFATSVWAHLP